MEAQALITHLGPWSLGKGSLQYKLTRAVVQAIKHGLLNPEGPHAGDLPNLDVPSNGKVDVTLNLPSVTLREGRHSLLQRNGTSFVIHANPDDGLSDPAGNSGARIACGVIRSLNAPGLETR